jgi:hypothetical protein
MSSGFWCLLCLVVICTRESGRSSVDAASIVYDSRTQSSSQLTAAENVDRKTTDNIIDEANLNQEEDSHQAKGKQSHDLRIFDRPWQEESSELVCRFYERSAEQKSSPEGTHVVTCHMKTRVSSKGPCPKFVQSDTDVFLLWKENVKPKCHSFLCLRNFYFVKDVFFMTFGALTDLFASFYDFR